MSKLSRRSIEVWADWTGLGGPHRMGTLCATPSRRNEVFSFEYDPETIQRAAATGSALAADTYTLEVHGFSAAVIADYQLELIVAAP